jgi:hypothetical protein
MTLVLWTAWRILDRPASGSRWATFAVVAVAAGFLSTIGALLAATALAVCLVASFLTRPRRVRWAVVTAVSFGALVGPWMVLAVRPNVHQKLNDYWRGRFLDGDGFAGGIWPRLERLANGFQDVVEPLVLILLLAAVVLVLARRPLVGVLLVSPFVVALVLAALRVVPIGTGRTDVYLFPSFAFVIAVAVAEVGGFVPADRRWLVAVVASAVFVVIVVAAAPADENTNIHEELTPLVQLAERERLPTDEILVYPSAGYAYGIATRYPISRRPDELAATDWVVHVNGPRITVLREHRRDPEKWARPLDRITEGAPRIWLLGSHLYGNEGASVFSDWLELKRMLKQRGYRKEQVYNRRGAQATLLVRDQPDRD